MAEERLKCRTPTEIKQKEAARLLTRVRRVPSPGEQKRKKQVPTRTRSKEEARIRPNRAHLLLPKAASRRRDGLIRRPARTGREPATKVKANDQRPGLSPAC